MSVSYLADRLLRSTGGLVGRVLGSRAWVLCTVSAAVAAMLPGAIVAQDGSHAGVRVSFKADRAALTVGDLVALTLEVTHPADHVVVVPRLGPEWGPFEVISQTTAHVSSNGDGTETTSQRLTVTVFALGTFETPDLSISVRGPDGGVERVFPLPVLLTVNSVLSGPDERLKDIRPAGRSCIAAMDAPSRSRRRSASHSRRAGSGGVYRQPSPPGAGATAHAVCRRTNPLGNRGSGDRPRGAARSTRRWPLQGALRTDGRSHTSLRSGDVPGKRRSAARNGHDHG